MKLKFLGKKVKSCSACRSKAILENKSIYKLIAPFGIRTFRVGTVYELPLNEYEFFKKMTYSVGGVILKYFKEL